MFQNFWGRKGEFDWKFVFSSVRNFLEGIPLFCLAGRMRGCKSASVPKIKSSEFVLYL
jgi:hypothetical protein